MDLIKEHVFRKPSMKDEPFILQEAQSNTAMKLARKVANTLEKDDTVVFTIDGPEKLRKRKDGSFFTKKIEEDQSCVHAVAVIGASGYKSPLYWYDQPTNDNGKMSDAMYPKLYEKVFADIRKDRGSDDWILWEDGDASHGSVSTNKWKKKHGYECYQNIHCCPETNPIEDKAVANVIMDYVKRSGASTITELRRAAEEGWAKVDSEHIKLIFEDMPERWELLKADGGKRINR